jgi:polyphosphate glucokinase
MHTNILGVDVGASGIKGALVDLETGKLLGDRVRLVTPEPSTPQAMAEAFAELVRTIGYRGPVGCGFPAIVKKGVALSAANIDKSWIGYNIETAFSAVSGCTVKALNDADAAGLAEVHYGDDENENGVVMLLTLGTGIGSALFVEGQLVPNTELGHLFLNNRVAEHYAANSVRENESLSWEEWAARLNEYLRHLERLFSPDLFILGGGVSKEFADFGHLLHTKARVKPAKLLNNAGIVGAAAFASF